LVVFELLVFEHADKGSIIYDRGDVEE
jgi:hypothetical protein